MFEILLGIGIIGGIIFIFIKNNNRSNSHGGNNFDGGYGDHGGGDGGCGGGD